MTKTHAALAAVGLSLIVPAFASAHSGTAQIVCVDPLSNAPQLRLTITTANNFTAGTATFAPTIFVNGHAVVTIPPSLTVPVVGSTVAPIAPFLVDVTPGQQDTTGSAIPFVNGTFKGTLSLPAFKGACGVPAMPPPPSPAPPPVLPASLPLPLAVPAADVTPTPTPAVPVEPLPVKLPRKSTHLIPRHHKTPKIVRCHVGQVRRTYGAWTGHKPKRHLHTIRVCLTPRPLKAVTG